MLRALADASVASRKPAFLIALDRWDSDERMMGTDREDLRQCSSCSFRVMLECM